MVNVCRDKTILPINISVYRTDPDGASYGAVEQHGATDQAQMAVPLRVVARSSCVVRS